MCRKVRPALVETGEMLSTAQHNAQFETEAIRIPLSTCLT